MYLHVFTKYLTQPIHETSSDVTRKLTNHGTLPHIERFADYKFRKNVKIIISRLTKSTRYEPNKVMKLDAAI